MPTRRQIRETVVQFLYCSDLEGGADPASLRGPFWQFVTESDRKALDVATLKTLQHINLGREGRLKDFTQRLPRALAALRADESLEAATENLERIEQLEEEWTEVISLISRIPRDDESFTERFATLRDRLFSLNRELMKARTLFRHTLEDYPKLRAALEPVAGTNQRLSRISERIVMLETPEGFPDQADLRKIRDSRAEMEALRTETDRLADAVLAQKESLDGALEQIIDNFAPERIDPIDRAILRLGAWEILHNADVPKPVAINEAIELAKKFGTSDSGRFVNGILDQIPS